MKEAENIEIIEQCLNANLLDNKHRQAIINKVTVKLLVAGYRVEEALFMFFWKLADLEPPLTHEEQLFFRALYKISHICCDIRIDSREAAFEILKISKEKLDMPQKESIKEVKIAYWKYFNGFSHNPKALLANACEIVVKKKAFNFLISEAGH